MTNKLVQVEKNNPPATRVIQGIPSNSPSTMADGPRPLTTEDLNNIYTMNYSNAAYILYLNRDTNQMFNITLFHNGNQYDYMTHDWIHDWGKIEFGDNNFTIYDIVTRTDITFDIIVQDTNFGSITISDDDQYVIRDNTTNNYCAVKLPSTKPSTTTCSGTVTVTMNPGSDPKTLFHNFANRMFNVLQVDNTTSTPEGLEQHVVSYEFVDNGLSNAGFNPENRWDLAPELISIDSWKNVHLGRGIFTFSSCSNLRSLPSDPEDIPIFLPNNNTLHYATINMGNNVDYTERDYSNMKYWNINNSISLTGLFYTIQVQNCNTRTITQTDGTTYTAWDTSNVRSFNRIFNFAYSFQDMSNIDLNWDTSKGMMFLEAFQNAVNCPRIGQLDYSSCISFYQMIHNNGDFTDGPFELTEFLNDFGANSTVRSIAPQYVSSNKYYLGNIETYVVSSPTNDANLENLLLKGFTLNYDGLYNEDQIMLHTRSFETSEGLPTSLAISTGNNCRIRITVAKSLIINDTTEDLNYFSLWSWQRNPNDPTVDVNVQGESANWEVGIPAVKRTVSNDNQFLIFDFDINLDLDLVNGDHTNIGIIFREYNWPGYTRRRINSWDIFADLSGFTPINGKYYVDVSMKNLLNKPIYKTIDLDYSVTPSMNAVYEASDKYILVLNDIGGFNESMWYGEHQIKIRLDPTKYTYITGRADPTTKILKSSDTPTPKYLSLTTSDTVNLTSSIVPNKIVLKMELVSGRQAMQNEGGAPNFYIWVTTSTPGIQELVITNNGGNLESTLNGEPWYYTSGYFTENIRFRLDVGRANYNILSYEYYQNVDDTDPYYKFDPNNYEKDNTFANFINEEIIPYNGDINTTPTAKIGGGDFIEDLYTFNSSPTVSSYIINGIEEIIISSNANGYSGFDIYIGQVNPSNYKLPFDIREYTTDNYINGLLPDQTGDLFSTHFNPKFTRAKYASTADHLIAGTTEDFLNIQIVSPLDSTDADGDDYSNEQTGTNPFGPEVANKFILVQEGTATFDTMLTNAENAGAKGVIVYQSNVNGPMLNNFTISEGFTIPIILTDNFTGQFILQTLRRNKVLVSMELTNGAPTGIRISYPKSITIGDEPVGMVLLDNTLPQNISITDSTTLTDISQTFSTSQVTNYFYNSTRFPDDIETSVAEFNGIKVTGTYNSTTRKYNFKCTITSNGKVYGESTIDGSGFPYMLADRVTGADGTQYDINIHGIGSTLFSIDDLSVVIPCLTETCNVLTPNGYVNVTGLKEGEMVTTSDNRQVPITRIFKSVSTTLPRVIRAKQYGNIPLIDTHLSDCHAYKVGSKWKLPKDENLEVEWSADQVTYYHIELPDYYNDHLVVNGLTTESWDGFLPNDIRPHMWEKVGKNKTSVVLKIKN